MSRPGVTIDDLATTNRSIPVNTPHPPAKPILAPTGSPGVNSVIDVINSTAAPFQNAPPAEQGVAGVVAQGLGGVLGVMGAPQMIIDTAFASLTAPVAKLFPAMPAITLGGMHIGTPHTHAHPPSLVAPGVMVPLPSIGPVMGSCAVTVLIGGRPAARAGDIGIAITCGSLAPPFNIHTGSSNVFIGGARAARMGDVTEHCNPEGGAEMSAFALAMSAAGIAAGAAGAMATGNSYVGQQAAADAAMLALRLLCGKDPGIPPCVGALIGPPVPNVLIGGFPCPPVGEMAVGGLLKALKSAAAGLKKKFNSRRGNAHCGSASEPVYVVTGENFNAFVDFVSGGLFEWRRHYTTARARDDGPLGHGWRHFYQRSLALRLHRAVFTDWDGVIIEFPRFERGADTTYADGYVLKRLGVGHYQVSMREQPVMEFVGNEFGRALRLVRIKKENIELGLEYDALGRLASATERTDSSEKARHFQWQYDASGHVTQLTEILPANGHNAQPLVRSAYLFDAAANMSRAYDALGGTWAYEYDAFHRWTKQTDPRNYSYTWRYDAVGRCVEASGEDRLWWAKLEYLPDQRKTRLTQGDDATWEYHYDGDGFITKIVDPYGGVKARERDSEGKLVREVDSGGREMRWLYDRNDAHYARVDRFGNVFPPELEMAELPNPFERKLPDTARGRLFEGAPLPEHTALGPDESLLYAVPYELHHQARLCFPMQKRTVRMPSSPRIERDALGRKTREIDRLGRTREWHYDETGNMVASRDRDGRISNQRTISWNLVGEKRSPLGHAMHFEYSRLEQIVLVKDPLGNETRYDYDLKERLVRVHRGGRVREEYVYDQGDHFVEKRDGLGAIIFRNERDPNHFVKTRHLASGGVHIFGYDERGRIIEASTDKHHVELAYDHAGQRIRDVHDGLGIEREYAGGAIRTTVLGRFVFVARSAGAATRLLNPAGKETRLAYRDDGVVERLSGNGTIELMQHDIDSSLVGRLTYRRDDLGRLTQWGAAYSYTADGDLVRRDDSKRGTARFEVDEAHRLVAEVTAGGERFEFSHDSADNLRLGALHVGSGNRLGRSADESFTYDDRDRLAERRKTDGSTVRYVYDSFDLLVRIERVGRDGQVEPAWTASYDAIGRRIATECGEDKREFYWDGDRLAAEKLPNGELRIYEYATDKALVPLGFVDYASRHANPASGQSFYVFSEPSGMPLHVENDEGRVVWWVERVHPFGPIDLRPAATIEYNLRWPGHYFDQQTGLHYNRYRYYDPGLGRYLQSDPIGYAGSPVNLYSYCTNPLIQVDVLGLHPEHADGAHGTKENAGEPDGREASPSKPLGENEALTAALDEVYAKARGAKTEIDDLASRVAEQHGGTVAKAPLKSRERALQKIMNDYEGDASRIKDVARNTIVVPRGQEKAALATLMKENPSIRPEHVKVVEPESNPLGYSGINVTAPTQSGLPGEIQINNPEMIYAKEPAGVSRSILGDSKVDELTGRPDLPPGGQGHQLYEEWRNLPPKSQEAQDIASTSRDYYNAFRR